ncbi:MAG TPA: RecX family transcriptional regulator [Candidatus Angelobacter sp.]|nr:RecX family transcriptional regulator [Candidatus Angelobacter sp.]
MRIISKIAIHPKKRGIYEVELTDVKDPERLIMWELHEDLLVQFGLRKGLPITNQKFTEIEQATLTHGVYSAALNFISYRMRSIKEVKTYLLDKGYSTVAVLDSIQKLKEENYLDDRAYALAYVRSRKSLTLKGPNVIRQELIQKGISEDFLGQALEQFGETEQMELAAKLALKKLKSWTGRSHQEQLQKLRQVLLQKGFSNRVVNQVINNLPMEDVKEDEWTALTKQGEKALQKYKQFTGYEQTVKVKQLLYRKGFSPELIDSWINKKES